MRLALIQRERRDQDINSQLLRERSERDLDAHEHVSDIFNRRIKNITDRLDVNMTLESISGVGRHLTTQTVACPLHITRK